MQIRRARPDDFLKVRSLLTQLMPGRPHGQQAMWDALAGYPGYGAWVAKIGDALLVFSICSSSLTSLTARPSRLSITSSWENPFADAGWASACCTPPWTTPAVNRPFEVHIWTDSDNARAIQLYKNVGFAERALLLELDTSRLDDSAPRK